MPLLDDADRARFADDGYLLLPGLLDPTRDLEPLRVEYADRVDALAIALREAGEISSTHADLPFGRRISALFAELGSRLHGYLDISLPQKGVGLKTPVHTGPAAFGLITNPRLLDAVESIVGPEIYSNPTQHVRIKPPVGAIEASGVITPEVATTVWHQDLATIMPEADESEILTVWVAVTEATRANGCLLVAPGSHKRGLALHCHDSRASYSRQAIPEPLIGDRRVALEARPGDVLLLDRFMMHASLPNLSDDIRWSVDLRYQATGQPTGRPWFPGFVARSRAEPGSVLSDAAAWTGLWDAARANMVAAPPRSFQRWPEGNPDCA